jgi:hypothetical protein
MLQCSGVKPPATQDLVRFYRLPHERIVDLIFLLEGYEGIAVPRTLDKEQGIIELLIAPDFLPELEALLRDLREELQISEIPKPDHTKSKSILD